MVIPQFSFPIYQATTDRESEVMKAIQAFFRDDEAATAVEYAVMLAMILVTVIAAISSVGSTTGGMWGDIKSDLNAHGF